MGGINNMIIRNSNGEYFHFPTLFPISLSSGLRSPVSGLRSSGLMRYITFIFLLFVVVSCRETLKYSETPEITQIVSFEQVLDSITSAPKGRLTFMFTDGDGDMGLAPGDTFAPYNPGSDYYYNFFITLFERQHGEFVLIEPPMPLHARIPVLAKNPPEPIEVKLAIDVDINPFSEFDTVYYEFFVVDRALNHSNTIKTPEIIINR